MKHVSIIFFLCAAMLPVGVTYAADSDIEFLKRELQLMRQQYEARIQKLESKIVELAEKQQQPASNNASNAPAASAAQPQVTSTAPRNRQNAFNPGISAILDGKINSYSRNPDNYAIPGFQLGEEAGLAREGLSAEESEINITGNIDDRFFGNITFALLTEDGETEIELEEAYIESIGLFNGFGVKAGRFFSEVGYLNKQHAHTWDFVDQPLVYRAMLGTQYTDDGVQVRYVAPTDTFLQLGGEYLRGAGFPAAGDDNEGKGVYSLFAHLGGDIGDSYSWRLGLSGLWAETDGRESDDVVFSGDSNLAIADAVLKWAPNGNPTERNLKLQAELFYRDEDGDISIDEGTSFVDYDGEQGGFYAQAVYQFMPRWRVGARYDRLWSDNDSTDATVLAAAGLDDGHDPSRFGVMLDYTRNEFNRVRLQYNRDKSRQGNADNQFSLQYIMIFGAHGGHEF